MTVEVLIGTLQEQMVRSTSVCEPLGFAPDRRRPCAKNGPEHLQQLWVEMYLFNHLVTTGEEHGRDRQAEDFGSPKVDRHFQFRWEL